METFLDKSPQEFTEITSTKCHQRNVHEQSPKKRTFCGHFCPRDVAQMCPRDVCHPYNGAHMVILFVWVKNSITHLKSVPTVVTNFLTWRPELHMKGQPILTKRVNYLESFAIEKTARKSYPIPKNSADIWLINIGKIITVLWRKNHFVVIYVAKYSRYVNISYIFLS